jgi:hypothetical protein
MAVSRTSKPADEAATKPEPAERTDDTVQPLVPEPGVAYYVALERNPDGSPHVQEGLVGWKLMVPEGALDEHKAAAWGHPDGELPPDDAIVIVPNPTVTTSAQYANKVKKDKDEA